MEGQLTPWSEVSIKVVQASGVSVGLTKRRKKNSSEEWKITSDAYHSRLKRNVSSEPILAAAYCGEVPKNAGLHFWLCSLLPITRGGFILQPTIAIPSEGLVSGKTYVRVKWWSVCKKRDHFQYCPDSAEEQWLDVATLLPLKVECYKTTKTALKLSEDSVDVLKDAALWAKPQ